MRTHISFSELKNWNDCPYKHKLIYIDKIKEFVGNEHTAFGHAIHDTCEELLLSGDFDTTPFFKHKFMSRLEDLRHKGVEFKSDLVKSMWAQGPNLPDGFLAALKDYVGDCETYATEYELYEELEHPDGKELFFKGYIDAVLKTKDGKYHIFDWKTCSWGWDSKRKTDRMTTYQLTLYKHFFAVKNNIDPSMIETHFGLLKRTAKKNRIEMFKVPTGKKKIENALKLLQKAIYNIAKEKYIKNRLSCTSGYGCEFFDTKHCR